MSTINDGGPAFGRVVSRTSTSERANISNSSAYIDTVGGMSLRDWFAGQALAGWLASFSGDVSHPHKTGTCEDVSNEAYALADAMLAARQQKGAQ